MCFSKCSNISPACRLEHPGARGACSAPLQLQYLSPTLHDAIPGSSFHPLQLPPDGFCLIPKAVAGALPNSSPISTLPHSLEDSPWTRHPSLNIDGARHRKKWCGWTLGLWSSKKNATMRNTKVAAHSVSLLKQKKPGWRKRPNLYALNSTTASSEGARHHPADKMQLPKQELDLGPIILLQDFSVRIQLQPVMAHDRIRDVLQRGTHLFAEAIELVPWSGSSLPVRQNERRVGCGYNKINRTSQAFGIGKLHSHSVRYATQSIPESGKEGEEKFNPLCGHWAELRTLNASTWGCTFLPMSHP